MSLIKEFGLEHLSSDQRRSLGEELLDSAADDAYTLTDAQLREIDRRVAAIDSGEMEMIPWEVVKAKLDARFGR